MATLYVTHTNGTVEAIPIASQSAPDKVVLGRAPLYPLAVSDELARLAEFDIAPDSSPVQRAFLVTDKEPRNPQNIVVRAINFDLRYYANDVDSPPEDVTATSSGGFGSVDEGPGGPGTPPPSISSVTETEDQLVSVHGSGLAGVTALYIWPGTSKAFSIVSDSLITFSSGLPARGGAWYDNIPVYSANYPQPVEYKPTEPGTYDGETRSTFGPVGDGRPEYFWIWQLDPPLRLDVWVVAPYGTSNHFGFFMY